MLNKIELKLFEELKKYNLPKRVLNYYVKNKKEDINYTYESIKKELILKMMLGKEAPINNITPWKRIFYYGNTIIKINEREKIIAWIGFKEGDFKIEVDKKKKEWLKRALAA